MTATAPDVCPAAGARVVPQIVIRTGQQIVRGPLRITADGIAYPDPRPDDRDADGFLWARVTGTAAGPPEYAVPHPRRQRAAMENPARLLCQVGMGPATATPDGVLWLVPRPRGTAEDPLRPRWPAGRIVEPPVCAAHAPAAAHGCPRLRESGYAALLVRRAPLVAVRGTLYRPTPTGEVVRVRGARFELEDDGDRQDVDARFLLADHLVRDLEDVTPVDLRDRELYRDAVPCDAGA
ncbi:hypothetical protein ACIQMY_20570 [Streptomyces sp. NPDC091368]|uniref:hypothetical protein n=1 Tax=Streptomyces sp. NPDC091368 TaxID=3365993 RepID=UPI0037FD49AC